MVDELTTAQALQDRVFMSEATDKFIKPLYDEITSLNPEYASYTGEGKFAYLVSLDKEGKFAGDELMLDFGGNMWTYVHAGKELGINQKVYQGDNPVEYYTPRFISDLHHNRHPLFSVYDKGNVASFLANERETYECLPIPYKVALLSLYITQNIVIDSRSATYRVAACGQYLETSGELSAGARFHADYWLGADGRYKGWSIRIRELKPPKIWWDELAAHLRENTIAIDDCYGNGELTDKPVKTKKPRGNQDRTDDAVVFVYDYLPSIGKHPGKNGYSWKAALNDFEKHYPEYKKKYSSSTSFQKSVKQAKARREGR